MNRVIFMCGIIACIKTVGLANYILNGLKKEDYRGYDSCGIGYLNNDRIEIIKSLGEVNLLKEKINQDFQIAIAHTRWATHGKNTLTNAHPHVSNHKLFALVHNGTINNYQELKKDLLNLGFSFYSDTDTEVIVNLLEYEYGLTLDVIKAIENVKEKLQGTYALCILFAFEEKVYFLRHDSPLSLGVSKDSITLVSDINAFQDENRYLDIDEGEYGFISRNKFIIYKNYRKVKKELMNLNNEENNINLKTYQYYMEKEIYEIPEKIERLLQNVDYEKLKEIHKDLKKAKKIIFIGCGTSYHACLIAKKYFNKESEVIIASEFYLENYTVNKDYFYIFVSQSGETMDVLKSLDYVQKVTNNTLSLTNANNSILEKKTKYDLNIYAEKEIAVASTKAYINEIYLLFLLGTLDKSIIKNYHKNDLIINAHEIKEIKEIASFIKNKQSAIYIGKGEDYFLALEAALKLKEVSYIHVEAMYAGELKHGSIALIEEDFPVFVIQDINNNKNLLSPIEEIKSRGGKLFIFNYEHNSLISLTKMMMKCFLLAFYTSYFKNNNIDKPRNLAKSVTVE